MRYIVSRSALGVIAVLASTTFAPRVCQPAERVAWRGSADAKLELEGIIRVTWPQNPLRDSLDNLARARRVAVWLDRRIDPDQIVEYRSEEVSLHDALRELAGQLDGGVCQIGPVVFIGPSAATLSALSAQRTKDAKPSAAVRTRLARTQPWQWEELSVPRELVQKLAADANFKVEGIEQIPNDLWRAADWPALTLADRLSLVLAGFDLTFDVSADGKSLKLVPFPKTIPAERSHAVKGSIDEAAAKVTKMFPRATVRPEPGKLAILALPEEHAQIEQMLKEVSGKRPVPPGAQKRYTLKIEKQPVQNAAKAIAQSMKLGISFDPKLKEQQLSLRVSFDVKEVTIDELFEALLKPAGLAHRVQGGTIEVFERK